jgi:FAD/FMN-containing dehydrogenase
MNLQPLRTHFRGEILTPESAGYNQARQIWNGMIDRRPAAILRCSGPDDVRAAVRFAVEQDIYPAIRAGGHNVAGIALVDNGLVIDVTQMKGIAIDAATRTALAQTGLTWGEFDGLTQSHGLATTGGLISTTGIAGLTLGGGVGWLMGRCGLVCDNTLAYEIVTADGELITANEAQHADLFWALKGGGGNFGVVTSITYNLYPISNVISGMILYPMPEARSVLRNYRDFVTADLPDELIVYAAAVCTPEGVPVMAILPAYCGDDLDEGERVLQPLRSLGTPIADLTARMPYAAMQQMLDIAAPYGIRSYWKSNYLGALPDAAIDTFVEFAEKCTSPRTLALLEHQHGASSRVPPEATAFTMRSEPFDFVIVGMWDNPADDGKNIEWARSFYAAMQPWSAGLVYVNALSEDDSARVPEAYGRNYTRLCDVKTKYDPENRFRRNHNIRPQAQTATGTTLG